MADDKPIIVVKKKGHGHGHHGGAWKIAYADFVTAMMAFFMVMWLLNTAESQTKQAIASYFRKPGIFQQGSGTPLEIGGSGIMEDSYAPPKPDPNKEKKWEIRQRLTTLKEEKEAEKKNKDISKGLSKQESKEKIDPLGMQVDEPSKTPPNATKKMPPKVENPDGKLSSPFVFSDSPPSTEEMTEVARLIKQKIEKSPELKEALGEFDIKLEQDGLNIEIMDTDKASMFASGGSKVLPPARRAFTKLAEILKPFDNTVDIIGHTDAKPFSNIQGGFSNWELSAARANEARKLLEEDGFTAQRIRSVVGKADRELKDEANPFASGNRRITLKMKFDLTKDINIEEDPEALSKAKEEAIRRQSAPTPPPATHIEEKSEGPSPTPTANAGSGGGNGFYKPKNIIKAKEIEKKVIRLPDVDSNGPRIEISRPDSESKEATPEKPKPSPQKDRLFGDAPVLAPGEIFSDIE